MINFRILFIIVCCFSISFYSKGQSLKKTSSIPRYINFEEKKDYILTRYISTVLFSRDMEIAQPLKFEIKLPTGVISWFFYNSSHFRFHYKNSEGIFIKTQLFDKISLPDSVYVPSQDEVLDMISYDYIELHFPRRDRRNWRLLEKGKILNNKKRKTVLIQKYDSKILLFNIKEKNFEEYYSLVESFRPLPE